jgi:hypothetical protein
MRAMELRNDFWAEELEIADDAKNDWIYPHIRQPCRQRGQADATS